MSFPEHQHAVLPRFLVSVRSAAEATDALRGGADIVDVKDPDAGPLGRAHWGVVADVTRRVHEWSPGHPVSAALGECQDWTSSCTATPLSGRSDQAPVPLAYVKMGLAGLCDDAQTLSQKMSWQARVRRARSVAVSALWSEQTAPGSGDPNVAEVEVPAWVAVAYADNARAGSPPVGEVLEEAVASRAAVLLIDTFGKDESTLLDWQSLSQLESLRMSCGQHGIQLALAGRLALPQIRLLCDVRPDIIAVRGAACLQGQRTSTICADRVAELKRALAEF